MKEFININQQNIYLESLNSLDFSVMSNAFEKQSLEFCQQWIAKKQTFTLNTSGSTGKPKPIVLTRTQMQASAALTVDFFDLGRHTKALVCIPTAYIGGKMMLVRGLEYDWDLYIIDPSSQPFRTIQGQIQAKDATLVKELQSFCFDFVALVPLQMEKILEDTIDFSSVLNQMKAIILGGGPVSLSLEEKIKKLSVPVYHTYGMTETVSHIALKKLNGEDAQSYFQILPNVKIRQDSRGALAISSPTTADVWIQTNDLVEILSEHRFIWKGRTDNVINSGGIKIHPELLEPRIEQVMDEIGWDKDFFLAGMPEQKLGEKLVLLIESKTPSQEEQLRFNELLLKKLNKYEIPKNIVYLKQFSRTSTQKIQRKVTLRTASLA